jgi:hypothetical protein
MMIKKVKIIGAAIEISSTDYADPPATAMHKRAG